MQFKVLILGSNSAMPAHGRNQSSQLVFINNQHFLVDCGEGTQLQLAKYHQKVQRINHIFISHLHGDHYFGLVGLLSSMHLQGRSSTLNIYGPRGLDEIIWTQFRYSQTITKYEIRFHEIDSETINVIYEDDDLYVETIPLQHRIPCTGFLFREKQKPYRIKKDILPENILLQEIIKLKNGEDVLDEKGILKYENSKFTFPPRKSRSYAYCSDTKFKIDLIDQLKEIDLLYHESTFLKDQSERASNTFHSTAEQAATIAKEGNIGQLILGHFSTRYKELDPILEEAKSVFDSCHLGIEGSEFEVAE